MKVKAIYSMMRGDTIFITSMQVYDVLSIIPDDDLTQYVVTDDTGKLTTLSEEECYELEEGE